MVFSGHSVMNKWWIHTSSRILLFILPGVKCRIIFCSSDSQSCFMWPPSAVQVRQAERQLTFTATVSVPFNTHIWSLFFFSNWNKKTFSIQSCFYIWSWEIPYPVRSGQFLSVCKLHYVEVITFILNGNFIRLFCGAVQFFKKHRCDTHLVGSFSFLFSCLLFYTSVF